MPWMFASHSRPPTNRKALRRWLRARGYSQGELHREMERLTVRASGRSR